MTRKKIVSPSDALVKDSSVKRPRAEKIPPVKPDHRKKEESYERVLAVYKVLDDLIGGKDKMPRIITAFPTSGKSSAMVLLRKLGVPVMDMDIINSVIIPVYFKNKLPYNNNRDFDHLIRSISEPLLGVAARSWLDASGGILFNNLTAKPFVNTIMRGGDELPIYLYPTREDLIKRLQRRDPDMGEDKMRKNLTWYEGIEKNRDSMNFRKIMPLENGQFLSSLFVDVEGEFFTKKEIDQQSLLIYRDCYEFFFQKDETYKTQYERSFGFGNIYSFLKKQALINFKG